MPALASRSILTTAATSGLNRLGLYFAVFCIYGFSESKKTARAQELDGVSNEASA